MSDSSQSTGASRRDVLKSGALGVGTLAGLAGASTVFAPSADAATGSANAQVTTSGTDSYFLKLDGVPGDSTDAAHKGEIQLLAFSWGVSNPGSASSSGGAGAGKANFSDFNFTAHTSKASPLLMLNTATGKHLKSATLTGSRRVRGGSQDFLKIELTEVLITSYQQGASGGELPTDSSSLRFGKIKYTFESQSPNGTPGTTTSATWDIISNKTA